MTEYSYLIEKADKRVSIKCDTLNEMLEIARNYHKQDIEFDCYSIKKTEVFPTNHQLKERL